jgi:hypothetical protein
LPASPHPSADSSETAASPVCFSTARRLGETSNMGIGYTPSIGSIRGRCFSRARTSRFVDRGVIDSPVAALQRCGNCPRIYRAGLRAQLNSSSEN